MSQTLDARGQRCPMPVILAKRALDGGAEALTVLADDHAAVENLTRLAESRGLTAQSAAEGDHFVIQISGGDGCTLEPEVRTGAGTYLIGKDHVGEGDEALGRTLMEMFLYTLTQAETPPACLIFLNGGVRIPAGEEGKTVECLKELAAGGCEIMVCGTCLNYYGLTERLKVGRVSNMYDIVEKMQGSERVVTV